MRAAVLMLSVLGGAAACARADAGPAGGGRASSAARAPGAPSPPSSEPGAEPVAVGVSASAPGAGPGAASAPGAAGFAANGAGTAETAPGAVGSAAGGAGTAEAAPVPWAQRLAPLLFRDVNTMADVAVRLYRDDGTLDEAAAREVERVLWSAKDDDAPRMSRRLLQLVVKAAAHFDAHEVQVVSSHRDKARPRSRHRTGEALDFVFPGVSPRELAEHLRTFARVGVGMYVHPRSRFVHLDVREQSYHWIDGSPPGRHWREHPLPDPTSPSRDAAYTASQDLPEGAK